MNELALFAGAAALLREAVETIDTLPGYPKGADLCDRIEELLAAAPPAPEEAGADDIEQLTTEAMRVAREYGLMRATDEEVETAIDNLAVAAYRTRAKGATK